MFFPALAIILSNLPRWLERVVFALLYPVYSMKFGKEKNYISNRLKKANLQIKPRDVYRNLFFNGLDSLRFLRDKKISVKFENLDLAQNEIGKTPVVFASIHLGAFEMLHRGVAQIAKDCSVNLIVSEFRNKNLDTYLTSVRKTRNMKIAKDYEVSKILKNAIRNKEIIAIMADQSKQGAEYFHILGDEVPLFLKLPLAANRLGASLVFFRTFRKDGWHTIKFERVYKPQTKIVQSEIAKMFENWILEYPEQWVWNYL
jgi:KDO2-lipid IV(A) lauroyltransferase